MAKACKRATLGLWFSCRSATNSLSHLHSERGRGVLTITTRWIWKARAHANESLAPGNFRDSSPTAAIPSNISFAKGHFSGSLKSYECHFLWVAGGNGRRAFVTITTEGAAIERETRRRRPSWGPFSIVVWSATISQTGILMLEWKLAGVKKKKEKKPF